MNDLLADTGSIQSTSGSIEEAAGNAMTLSNQVLAIAEGTSWQGRADQAFLNAVESFREQKDRLGQLLQKIGGDVDMAAMDHEENEETQTSGMNAKAGMMA